MQNMLGRHDAIDEIRVQVGDYEVIGTLAVPQGPVGLVIFASGARQGARDRLVAESLRARALATLECDLLRDTENRFDVELAASRLVALTDWLLQHSTVSHLPLGYFGAQTGCAAALIAASRRPEHVRAIVNRAGRPDLAGAALAIVRAPTLLVAGGLDEGTIEIARGAIEQMTACTQLAIIPGAGPAFEEPGTNDDVMQLASEWLIDHFAQALQQPAGRRGAWGRQFRDRRCAGERLAQLLLPYREKDVVVCGLPRGGVIVADEIAKELDAPLDVWLVRKIGMPIQPELGIGALAEGAALILDSTSVQWSGMTPEELRALVHHHAAEIRRRARIYRGDATPPDVHGRPVILVDDGVATAGALRAAIRGARKRGATKIIVATPVIAVEAMASVQAEADEVVCLAAPRHLVAVGGWYQDFRKVPPQEVEQILEEARRRFTSRKDVRAGA